MPDSASMIFTRSGITRRPSKSPRPPTTRACPGGTDAPGLLVDLLDLQLAAIALRAQPVDVTLVLANEIASRSPDREADVERLRSARFDLELHLRTTRFRLLNPEDVRVHGARSLLPGDEARDLLFIGGVRGKLEVARVCCFGF